MFSKEYFLYLVKSKKGLLIFEGIILLLMLLGIKEYGMWLFLAFSIMMNYFLSCNTFTYVHSKKAVDTYFSLPINRTALLTTGILFNALFSSVPMLFGILIKEILLNGPVKESLIFFLAGVMMVLVMSLFNTSLYLLGNNNVDGITLLGAYTLLPAFIYLAGYIFMEVYVAGYDGTYLDYTKYLSPSFLYILTYADLIGNDIILEISEYVPFVISFAAFALLSILILKKEYIERKVERAESISKNLFAYPMVIGLYMSLIMFGISSNFDGTISFFGSYFVLYLVLFAAFLASMFLYKRKFELNWKMPVIYISVMAVTIIIALVARNTRGFGIAYTYAMDGENTSYELYFYNVESQKIEDLAYEKSGYDENLYSVILYANNIESNNEILKEETLEVLRNMQLEAIENYYDENADFFGNMIVKEGCTYNKGSLKYKSQHSYYTVSRLTSEELKILLDDPGVEYGFEYEDGSFYGNNERVTTDWY